MVSKDDTGGKLSDVSCPEDVALAAASSMWWVSKDSGGRRPPRRKRGATTCGRSLPLSAALVDDPATGAAVSVDGGADVIEYHNCDELGLRLPEAPWAGSSAAAVDVDRALPAVLLDVDGMERRRALDQGNMG